MIDTAVCEVRLAAGEFARLGLGENFGRRGGINILLPSRSGGVGGLFEDFRSGNGCSTFSGTSKYNDQH